MHRTQILLEEWQYDTLKTLSDQKGISMSEVVREAVAQYLKGDGSSSAPQLADIEGIGDDPNASGRDHDQYLYPEKGE